MSGMFTCIVALVVAGTCETCCVMNKQLAKHVVRDALVDLVGCQPAPQQLQDYLNRKSNAAYRPGENHVVIKLLRQIK